MKLNDLVKEHQQKTALIYCPPGTGKSTFIGLQAQKYDGKVIVLDIDRTFVPTMAKNEVVHNFDNIEVIQVDTINTWQSWCNTLTQLKEAAENGKLDAKMIAVDNVSELERCILSDLGRQGKNKGVPAQSDYQYMQFKLVDSLRMLKALGCDVIWTMWEDRSNYTMPDGTTYTMSVPKISQKICDNICGLCNIVGKIAVNKDGDRGVLLEPTVNVYAKNQYDTRKSCLVSEF